MKIKIEDLTGQALDWVVANYVNNGKDPDDMFYPSDILSGYFTPSTNWAQGGPIIEREGIATCTQLTLYDWMAISFHGDIDGFGPTLLIAAMRCYVASKLGDTVEIPEELINV